MLGVGYHRATRTPQPILQGVALPAPPELPPELPPPAVPEPFVIESPPPWPVTPALRAMPLLAEGPADDPPPPLVEAPADRGTWAVEGSSAKLVLEPDGSAYVEIDGKRVTVAAPKSITVASVAERMPLDLPPPTETAVPDPTRLVVVGQRVIAIPPETLIAYEDDETVVTIDAAGNNTTYHADGRTVARRNTGGTLNANGNRR